MLWTLPYMLKLLICLQKYFNIIKCKYSIFIVDLFILFLYITGSLKISFLPERFHSLKYYLLDRKFEILSCGVYIFLYLQIKCTQELTQQKAYMMNLQSRWYWKQCKASMVSLVYMFYSASHCFYFLDPKIKINN